MKLDGVFEAMFVFLDSRYSQSYVISAFAVICKCRVPRRWRLSLGYRAPVVGNFLTQRDGVRTPAYMMHTLRAHIAQGGCAPHKGRPAFDIFLEGGAYNLYILAYFSIYFDLF